MYEKNPVKVLMITTQWPGTENPFSVPFLVNQAEALKKSGVEIDVFYFEGKRNPFRYLKAFFRLFSKLRKDKYDLVHAQWGQSALPVLWTSLPLIVTFHGSDLYGIPNDKGKYTLKGMVLRAASQLAAWRADASIFVSRELTQFVPEAKKNHVIPCGLDLDVFKPLSKEECRAKLGLSPTGKYVFFGGNPFRAVKRYPLAKDAVSLLNNDMDVEMFYADRISVNDMPLYLNAADVVLLTSLHEGSPTIIKEALACNIPIVSVEVGDVRSRLENIVGSYICDDSPAAIAAALQKALNNKPEGYESRTAAQEFCQNHIAQQIIRVYDSVLQTEPVYVPQKSPQNQVMKEVKAW